MCPIFEHNNANIYPKILFAVILRLSVMHIYKIILVGIIVCFVHVFNAQAQNIKAGIIGGANFTQVDGDDIGGFHKIGANIGVMGIVPLTEKVSFSLEILFAQKGSSTLPDKRNPGASYKMNVDYAEVPILFNYTDKKRMIFNAGISIGTLVRYKEIINGLENEFLEPPVNKRDYNLVLSATYLAWPKIGLNLGFQHSITPFAYSEVSNLRNKGQYHKIVNFRIIYFMGQAAWEEGDL